MTQTKVSTGEVVEAVVALLAEAEGRQLGEVMAELMARGPDMAIDSLRIVEILTRVEARYEICLQADLVTARSTRSVARFAVAVVNATADGAAS